MVPGVSQCISVTPKIMVWTLASSILDYFCLLPFPSATSRNASASIHGIGSIIIHIHNPKICFSDPKNYGIGTNIAGFKYMYLSVPFYLHP